jgi:hypothetical protein
MTIVKARSLNLRRLRRSGVQRGLVDSKTFKREMNRAKTMKSIEADRQNYWMGFMRGLRRKYHGEKFGTAEEHQLWLTADGDEYRRQRSRGYNDGLEINP